MRGSVAAPGGRGAWADVPVTEAREAPGVLAPGFAITCRACGGPSDPDADQCPYCGLEERHDAPTRARLVAHRARMRRALQQLRAIVTARVREGMGASPVLLAVLLLFLPIPAILIGFGLPLGIVFLVVPLLELPRSLGTPLAAVGFLLAIVGGLMGLVAGLAVPYFMLKRHAERVRRRAREIVLEMEATTAVVCPACGGHAAVVALGPDEPCPCPWCGAQLLPAASAEEAVRAAVQSLLAQHETVAQDVLGRLDQPQRRPRQRSPVSLPGYVLAAGGTVVQGTTDGIPVRAFNEVFEGVFVFRLEVATETGLESELFLVRPEVESAMRNLTREWGYALPERAVVSGRPGWLAYVGDGGALPPAPALAECLDRLGPSDALLVDPAGLSVWRRGYGLSRAWGFVEEHHATVATLARGLSRFFAMR